MHVFQFYLCHDATVNGTALPSRLALLTYSVLRLVISQCFRCCCVDLASNADEALRQGGFSAAVDSEDPSE